MDDKRTNLQGKQCLWQAFSCSFWDTKARGYLQLRRIKEFLLSQQWEEVQQAKWGKHNMPPPSSIYDMYRTEEKNTQIMRPF